MDVDHNGIPCETLIEPSVVDTVWAGGWIASQVRLIRAFGGR
jgi:hypothetical protein